MIVIVTDSTACLNRQEAQKLGVTHVPVTYTLDGSTHREHFVEENADYIERIQSAKTLATSQPPIAAYIKTFTELTQAGIRCCACPSARAFRALMPMKPCAPARSAGAISAWSIP